MLQLTVSRALYLQDIRKLITTQMLTHFPLGYYYRNLYDEQLPHPYQITLCLNQYLTYEPTHLYLLITKSGGNFIHPQLNPTQITQKETKHQTFEALTKDHH